MRITIILFSLIAWNIGLWAQSQEVFHLWEGLVPPTDNGITEAEEDKGAYVTNVTEATLTVYRPETPNGLAILACPGGSYLQVWQREMHNIAQWYNEQGILFAVLKYRLPNGHKEIPLDDAHRAMAILREHQQEYGFTQLGVQGNSAGGHLASTLATHYRCSEERPDFQILFYPVISMDSTFAHAPSRENLLGKNPTVEEIRLYSNELQVNRLTPPAFIATSSNDNHVPVRNSMAYYDALLANRVRATLHVYPVGGHGWFNNQKFPYREGWMANLKCWLTCIAADKK